EPIRVGGGGQRGIVEVREMADLIGDRPADGRRRQPPLRVVQRREHPVQVCGLIREIGNERGHVGGHHNTTRSVTALLLDGGWQADSTRRCRDPGAITRYEISTSSSSIVIVVAFATSVVSVP